MSSPPEVRVLADLDEVGREAAEFFQDSTKAAIAARGVCRVALSGGSTPKALYEQLVQASRQAKIPWDKVRFYFGDERCVPPGHPDSNFGLADAALFRPLRIDAPRVARMKGEAEDVERAAQDYEFLLLGEFGIQPPAFPRFDLLLLGLGDDAHVASLFPHTPALDERRRLVVPNRSPRGIARRLTLTVPVLNQARIVLFLVTGGGKAPAVRTILDDPTADPRRYPARLVQPDSGRVVWFLDRAAAAQLRMLSRGDSSREE
jgi:6-phosphogluconolactonase